MDIYVLHDVPDQTRDPNSLPTIGTYYYSNKQAAIKAAKQLAQENAEEWPDDYIIRPIDDNPENGFNIVNSEDPSISIESIYIESVKPKP